MKHSTVDDKIEASRKASLKDTDRCRNNLATNMEFIASNIINVQQQMCVNGQSNEGDNVKYLHKGGPWKLPGTLVRHMQRRAKSMSEEGVVVKQKNDRESMQHDREIMQHDRENMQNGTESKTMETYGMVGGVPRSDNNSPVPR